MNVTLVHFLADVQSVEVQEFLMLIIAKNVFNWRKIEMDVRKLLIWGVQRQTFGMNGRNMGLKRDDDKLKI